MKEDIYLDVLPDVTDFVLKEIGIENQEHRKTILDKAKEIKEEDIEEAEDEQKEKESEQKKESSEQKAGKAVQTAKSDDKEQQPEQGKEASYAIRPEEIEYLDDVAQKRRKIGYFFRSFFVQQLLLLLNSLSISSMFHIMCSSFFIY